MNNTQSILDNPRISAVFSKNNILNKIASGKTLIIKSGIDPTATDLHLGHLVGLLLLKDFIKLGHKVVFVIGDFTAQLGDGIVRNKLSLSETKANSMFCEELITKILGTKNVDIFHQSEWFEKMPLTQFLSHMSTVSVQKLLTHETFNKKISDGNPLWSNEIVYPLLMAIDSVILKPDVEIGSLEQKFNFQITRMVMKKNGLEPEDFILNKRLPGIDGSEKMSKSLNNQIGLNENIDSQLNKLSGLSPELLEIFWELLSDSKTEQLSKNEKIKDILLNIHDTKEIEMAFERQGTLKLKIQKQSLIEILEIIDSSKSKREWKRLLSQGAIKVNEIVMDESNLTQLVKDGDEISIGKNKSLKIIGL